MSIIVGIDQGSSHTWAAASDLQGNILSVGMSFGACHAFDGIEKAMQAVNLSCEAALQLASIPRTKIQLIYSGMTGADWQDEFTLLHDSIVALNFCQQIFKIGRASCRERV